MIAVDLGRQSIRFPSFQIRSCSNTTVMAMGVNNVFDF